ncbi:MAG: hypothetical protein WB823_18540 [Steroidobacteraceae bacterium]
MAARTEIPQSVGVAPAAGGGFSLTSIQEVNERCLELLVYAARTDRIPPFSLVFPNRELLLEMTPELRKRAAAHAFLLLDFEFRNADWWTAVRQFPEKQFRGTAWRNPFPRRSAIPLTRATLMLAWQAIRTAGEKARIMLGMAEKVAEIIGDLQLTELDRIAERRHRHLEPRWADRPAVWRSLLSVASAPERAATKRVDAYGLQLLTGDLVPIAKSSGRAAVRRPHTVSPPPEG